MRNRSRDENEKNGFSFFRLAYIGLVLVLFIFSWYYLYQYRKDAEPQSTAAQSSSSAEKSVTLNAVIDTQPIEEDIGGRSPVLAGRIMVPTELPREPRSAETEEELNVQSVAPSENRTEPSVIFSGEGGASVSPADEAPPPALSTDKDPGAIIDWLVHKKNNNPRSVPKETATAP
jgi:hypothetical protein